MRKNIISSVFAALSIMLSACEEDLGEITFDEEPLMVVNALFEAEAESNVAQLSLTGISATTLLCNAEVAIFINGKLTETVTSTTDRYVIKSRFKAGDKVTIEATCDSLGLKASATCIVPQPLEITSTATTIFNKNVQGGRYDANYHMELFRRTLISTDNHSNENRYYRMTVDDNTMFFGYQYYSSGGLEDNDWSITREYSSNYYYNNDMALTDGQASTSGEAHDFIDWYEQAPNKYGIFRSSYFDNGCYTLKIDTRYEYRRGEDWLRQTTFNVRSITEAEYNYISGLQKLENYSSAGIVNNAPIVYSNIKGGCGIFAISTSTSITYDEYNLIRLTKDELYEINDKYQGNYAYTTQENILK